MVSFKKKQKVDASKIDLIRKKYNINKNKKTSFKLINNLKKNSRKIKYWIGDKFQDIKDDCSAFGGAIKDVTINIGTSIKTAYNSFITFVRISSCLIKFV